MNGIVALLGVGVAFVLVGFAVILPRSAWQAAPATPEPIVEFVHVEAHSDHRLWDG